MKRRIVILLSLFLILAIPSGLAFADTIVGEGETINNEVIIFDDNLEINEGSTVNGDVVIFGGNALIAGNVTGDIVLFGGNLEMTETAVNDGDCVIIGGNFTNSTDMSCHNVMAGTPDFLNDIPGIPEFNADFNPEIEIDVPTPVSNSNGWVEMIGSTIMMGILAFVIASFIPNQLTRIQSTVKQKTVVSGTVGVLTAVAVPSLIALLIPVSIILTFVCVGLLGYPIIFGLAVGFGVSLLIGWVAMGSMLGDRLARMLQMDDARVPLITALGTATLTLLMGLLGNIPFVFGEGILAGVLASVGLGATVLTHFGTKGYPRVMAAPSATVLDAEKVTAVMDTLPPEDKN